jgi:hypothetical protein
MLLQGMVPQPRRPHETVHSCYCCIPGARRQSAHRLRSRRHEQHRRQGAWLLVVLVRWLDHSPVRLGFGFGFGLRDRALVERQELQLLVQRLAERAGFGRLVELQRLGHAAEQQRQRGQRLQQRAVEQLTVLVLVVQRLADLAVFAGGFGQLGLDRKEAVKLRT